MAANDGFHRRMWYQLTQLVAEYRNRSTTVYLGPPGRAGTRTLGNSNPIYHPHCPQIPIKHPQPSLPGLTVYL